jgi:hypothetical protein
MRVTSPVFATQAPLIGEAGADPEGEESYQCLLANRL